MYKEFSAIPDAEKWAAENTVDRHGFAQSALVCLNSHDWRDFDSAAAKRQLEAEQWALAKQMLIDAGYQHDGQQWAKGPYTATVVWSRTSLLARIWISAAPTGTPVAYAAGEGGYLPPGDSPSVG